MFVAVLFSTNWFVVVVFNVPATPGLQGKRFIHYTTAASKLTGL